MILGGITKSVYYRAPLKILKKTKIIQYIFTKILNNKSNIENRKFYTIYSWYLNYFQLWNFVYIYKVKSSNIDLSKVFQACRKASYFSFSF